MSSDGNLVEVVVPFSLFKAKETFHDKQHRTV